MIAIIDYGMGNLRSVEKALQKLGAEVKITSEPEKILEAGKVVLPGVGAFRDAINELKKLRLTQVLIESIKSNKPFLGICLGMQLLFTKSEEGGDIRGLDIISGRVKRFSVDYRLKIPHIGWNRIKIAQDKRDCPLLKDIPDGSYMYFAHSYYVQPDIKDVTITQTNYGVNFSSMIWDNSIFGVQFHPEKSQRLGLKILENFVNL
jgi:glutamine amidotransferase